MKSTSATKHSSKKGSRARFFIIMLCILGTLWNCPQPLFAAEALEMNRPSSAFDDLSVSVEEDFAQSTADEIVYKIKFKNLSDHEVEYNGLNLQFPEMGDQNQSLQLDEADRRRRADNFQSTNSSGSSYSGPIFINNNYHGYHGYHGRSSGGGRCGDACVVLGIIFIVFFVVVIAAAVTNAVRESNKSKANKIQAEKAKEQKAVEQNLNAPIRLLRYQETTRSITMPRAKGRAVKSIMIQLKDGRENPRSFKAEMNAAPIT